MNSNKKITVLATAGLCNRMRTLASAISYIRNNKFTESKYLWERNKDCYAFFDELFQDIKGGEICRVSNFYLKESNKRTLFIPRLCRKFIFDIEIDDAKTITDASKFAAKINGKKNIFISSYSQFGGYNVNANWADLFKPIDKLQKRIDRLTSCFNDSVIGLHIRRTDSVKSIESSTDDKFFDVIDKELELNNDVKFYLATDSKEVIQEMKNKYGDKIISHNFDLSRNTTNGMEDAVVDLYVLASTSKIYGSFWSSYSEAASYIYNKPLIIVK